MLRYAIREFGLNAAPNTMEDRMSINDGDKSQVVKAGPIAREVMRCIDSDYTRDNFPVDCSTYWRVYVMAREAGCTILHARAMANEADWCAQIMNGCI